jgi:hypothetical protein
VLKFGGAKALTKHLHEDALKIPLQIEDAKVEVPQIINNSLTLGAPNIIRKPKTKMKNRMVKSKVTINKSRLEKATSRLYDLEDSCQPEKTLNVDFCLYQMEDY